MPPKGSKHIAYKWTPEAERLILLNVLKGAEFQATRHFFNQVAEKIGGGVTAEAVRYLSLPGFITGLAPSGQYPLMIFPTTKNLAVLIHPICFVLYFTFREALLTDLFSS